MLLLTDGDTVARIEQPEYLAINSGDAGFCVRSVAWWLAEASRGVVGHTGVSVGVAVALKEYESWLFAAIAEEGNERLARVEETRDPKRLVESLLPAKYVESVDQFGLTKSAPYWAQVEHRCRSYAHLQQMVRQIVARERGSGGVYLPGPNNG